MAKQRKLFITHAGELAHRLVRAVRPHGMIAGFAKSYASRHGRVGVVDEPAHVRELESTLGREAVLVMVAEVQRLLPAALGARKGRPLEPEEIAFAKMFWPEFMMALGRALEWPSAEAIAEREAFERDLFMYRRWNDGAAFPGGPVPESGISPFHDRCALLLDSSTMEEARLAAARFERELVNAAAHIINHLGQAPLARAHTEGRRSGPESLRGRPPKKKAAHPKRRPRR